jgi:hypothetical protein
LETGDRLALAAAQILQGNGPGQLQKLFGDMNPSGASPADSGERSSYFYKTEVGVQNSPGHEDRIATDGEDQSESPDTQTQRVHEENTEQDTHTNEFKTLKQLFGQKTRLKDKFLKYLKTQFFDGTVNYLVLSRGVYKQ